MFSSNNIRNRIIKNSFWLLVSGLLNQGVMLFLTIVLARYLGAQEYGEFRFAFSLVMLFAVAMDFGLSTLIVREIAGEVVSVGKFVSNILAIKSILGIFTITLIFITLSILEKSGKVSIIVYLFTIYLLINSFADAFRSVFRSYEVMQYEALSKIVQGVTLAIISWVMILSNKSVYWLTSAYIFSSALGLLVAVGIIYNKFAKKFFNVDKSFLWYVLRRGWPFVLSEIFVVIYFRIDVIMISLISGDVATGLYSAAYELLYFFVGISAIGSKSFFPQIVRVCLQTPRDSRKFYYKLLKVYFFSGLLFIVLSLIAEPMITLIYGSKFVDSIGVFRVLTLAGFLAHLSNVFVYSLYALNKQKLYIIIALTGAITNIVINWFLIPQWSIMGAAIATVITELIVALITMIYLSRYFKMTEVNI